MRLCYILGMLIGEKVVLRIAEEKDADTIYRLQSNIAARGEHFPLDLRTLTQIQARIREGGNWSDEIKSMLITEKGSGKIVGTISAFKPIFYLDLMEFGYILHDVDSRGKGYMTEAVQLYTDYFFKLRPITRIQIITDTENDASGRVAVKAGFSYECTWKHARLEGLKPVDMKIYALTREDWEQHRLAT